MEPPVVDRGACEKLFGVGRRQAIELMHGFGGYRSGNAVLLDRAALPAGVSFGAGRMTVEFSGVEDLLSKLHGLAQRAAAEFDSFCAMVMTATPSG